MVAEDFTEEEVFTVVGEGFTEVAGSGAEDSAAEEGSTEAEGFTVEVGSTGEADFAEEVFEAAAGFAEDPAFAGERSAAVFVEASVAADLGEAFAAITSGEVSVFADAVGVGVDGEIGMIGAGVGA